MDVPPLDINVVRKKYHSEPTEGHYTRLFMFDYDGTLTPIVSDPNAALPTEQTLNVLRKLSEDPANSVWIVSGRDANFLEQQWGHIEKLGLRQVARVLGRLASLRMLTELQC